MEKPTMTLLGVLIKVSDIDRSRDFYEKLGFTKDFDYGLGTESPETYHGTFYRISESAVIEIADAHEAVRQEVFSAHIETSKISIFIKVQSLVPILEAAHKHKITIATEPRRFPWHTLEMVIRDPDGLVVVFVSSDTDDEVRQVRPLTTADIERTEPNYAPRH